MKLSAAESAAQPGDDILPAHARLPGAVTTPLAEAERSERRYAGRAELRLAERAALWQQQTPVAAAAPLWEYVNILEPDSAAGLDRACSGG